MPYHYLLLHPNIPKPLHGMPPRELLSHSWWNQTKAIAKAKFNACWSCGVSPSKAKFRKWLEAHECYSIDFNMGQVAYTGTAALCHGCHQFIHDGRLLILLEKGEIKEGYYLSVLAHGNSLLKDWLGIKTPFIKRPFQANEPFCYHPEWSTVTKFKPLEWKFNANLPEAQWEDYQR
ncbi:hypothetical protein VB715_20990 [Crocosphaera sp. UHCC 0190]|uniref:hypothetical protein n=1 Tax=Crocosphaera sp. UHCC 0190 TaxID=3110246 RepID=UPI002B1EBA63|nr:hypothetical protein [Crocosphaera sp. UHCC 0190]MEA5512251.1 hypothetical protein [Crocosphaera sp. UHCC 0190]